jgi:hypothetical protein
VSLFTGGTQITGMYLGSNDAPALVYQTVTLRDVTYGYSKALSLPTSAADDLILLAVMRRSSTLPAAPDPTWRLYESMTSSGLSDNFASALYYKFAPRGGMSVSTSLPETMDWMMASFSGVDQTKPFGAYAESSFAMTNGTGGPMLYTNQITMSQPNGTALVVDIIQPKAAAVGWGTPTGYTKIIPDTGNDQWAIYRNNRLLPTVQREIVTASTKITGFVHTFEILPASHMSEPGLLTAVYLGNEKIWPADVNGGFGLTLLTHPGDFAFKLPAGATAVDIVLIGGGGGGSGSAGGITPDGDGGSYGPWKSFTARVGTEIAAGGVITGNIGAGGVGGNALFILPYNGEPTTVKVGTTTLSSAGGLGGGAVENRTGMTPPPYPFNGHTYVGGAGGNSTGSSGVPGEAPGGGGQGGDSQLFSTNGANGGAGGVYLYVY